MLKISSLSIILPYVLSACIKRRGVPNSISETYYVLSHKMWFLFAMWGTAGLLMPHILDNSEEGTECLAFMGLFGMFLVGAAPNFREEFEGKIHSAGAVLSLVGSQAWVLLNEPMCLIAWVNYLLYTIVYMSSFKGSFKERFMRTKPMFWLEVSALAATFSV